MVEAAAAERAEPPLPRWSLALACAIHAGAFAWAADALPWREWTTFAFASAIAAALHTLTAVLAALRARALVRVWRVLAAASLAFLAWCAWQVVASAVYVAALYGSLGRGIAALLAFALAAVVLFTLPIACWGIARTRLALSRRSAGLAALALVAATAAGLWRAAAAAEPRPVPLDRASPSELAALTTAHLPDWRTLPLPAVEPPPSLNATVPAGCEHPVAGDRRRATLVVHHLAAGANGVETRVRCLQGEPRQLAAGLGTLLGSEALRGPVKIDWIVTTRPLTPRPAPVESLALRPGMDGVCLGDRCLMPWQLVLLDQFNAITPLPFVPDFRFGFAAAAVRQALGDGGAENGVRGLTGIEVASLVVDHSGRLQPLRRLREIEPALDAERLARAARDAERHIARNQRNDGSFRNGLDPATGRSSPRRITLQRQAGTTLAMCELGRDRERVARVAHRSLAMLSRLERRSGELAGLVRGRRGTRARLSRNALPLVAFLACREQVGGEFDGLVAGMGRLLLALQRPDGGFHPAFDLERGQVVPGPVPLYADGQAVFALSLLEKHLAQSAGEAEQRFPPLERVRAAVERAMNYFARDYWDHPLRDFFFIEENWHCLAARASLGHHRNDAYERFCLDYAAFRARFLLDEHSDVAADFVGGFGFGNLFPPQNVPTAAFGETLVAAMAIGDARGLDLAEDRRRLERTLRFLLRQQWTEPSCFACARARWTVGGFSESMASPSLRIDYTQHAWAAIGHGTPLLRLPAEGGGVAPVNDGAVASFERLGNNPGG